MRPLSYLVPILMLCNSFAPAMAVPTPPAQATKACQGKQPGAACRFSTPRRTINGSCRAMPNAFACVPRGRLPARGSSTAANRFGRQGGMISQPLPNAAPIANSIQASSRVVDTAQVYCFDDKGAVIPCPQRGEKFFGQDAQYIGLQPAYHDNGDGTVSDLNSGLVWQKAHNAKRVSYYDAKRDCGSLSLGGNNDWRLPSLKELFSIANFSGSQGTGRFYLDRRYFDMAYPGANEDMGREASHHPEMMGQTWAATLYTGNHMGRNVEAAFFFNFFDGHIKNAPTSGPFNLFHRCVRGAEYLAHNDFRNNHDGSVNDNATRLSWQQADDGNKRDWPEALRYCSTLDLAGKQDWRLPNVKELQSIVDYSRNDPALDTHTFKQSERNGWFWSSTTHGDNTRMASYICFGKCTSAQGLDTHGAGAQRADPKTGNPASYTSLGGQRDAVRIYNYVRCVR